MLYVLQKKYSYFSMGNEEEGKMVSEKPSIRPNTVGPNIIPAKSSAITVGSFINLHWNPC